MKRMLQGSVAVVLLVVLHSGLLAEQQADIEVVDCDTSVSGWSVLDPREVGLPKHELSISNAVKHDGVGAISFHYEVQAGKVIVLARQMPLAGMTRVSFWIRSEHSTAVAFMLREAGGGVFVHPILLEGGAWKEISATVDNFRPTPESVVKDRKPDAEKILPTFILFDTAPMRPAAAKANTLWIDTLRVERGAVHVEDGVAVAAGETRTIKQNTQVNGDIHVGNGGRLIVEAARFHVNGDLLADGGSVEFRDTNLTVAQQYREQRRWIADHGGSIRFRKTILSTPFPLHLAGSDKATLDLQDHEMALHGFHVEVKEGSKLILDRVKRTGEIVLPPACDVTIKETDQVMVWFIVNPGNTIDLELPDGKQVEDWTLDNADLGMKLAIHNTKNIWWGLILQAGGKITLHNTEIYATGLFYGPGSRQTIKGIHNGAKDLDLKNILKDRTVSLNNSFVKVWNVYAGADSEVMVEDSLFGEIMTFKTAKAIVKNSRCDGSGGFVGPLHESSLTFIDSTIDGLLTTFGKSRTVLQNTTVNGDISATEDSVVEMTNSKVTGSVQEFGNGKVLR